MREIKFRGKSLNDDWVYGYLHVIDTVGEGYTGLAIQTQWEHNRPLSIQIQKGSEGQYTGLKDKNGREIYEGDIADVYYMDFIKYRAQIIFGEYEQDGSGGEYSTTECMGFYAKALNPDELDSDGIRIIPDYCKETSILALSSIEIIGNIYEYPYLLGGDS